MNKCARCGKENSDEVFFCQSCGTRLALSNRVAPEVPEGGAAELRAAVQRLVLNRLEGSMRPAPEPPARSPTPGRARATAPSSSPVRAGPAAPRPAPTPIPVGPITDDNPFRLILVHRDGSDGAVYWLGGDQVDIGRTEGELIVDDPHLSARHARIVATPTGRVLSSLEPRNGVYRRLRIPTDLWHGDQLLIGKQVLLFELLTEVEKTLAPALEQGVALFGTRQATPWARLRQLTAAELARDVFHLTRPDVVLGRETGDVIFSDDEFMSRRHAQISLRGGRTRLEDLGSSNGTFVRLRAPHPLATGDVIRLGDAVLRFEG